ncbi:MAG TPA: hypothetical protein PK837_00440 [bacterium]|nr:hypothetical protein [bacterium]
MEPLNGATNEVTAKELTKISDVLKLSVWMRATFPDLTFFSCQVTI